jgi:hypothetical protein
LHAGLAQDQQQLVVQSDGHFYSGARLSLVTDS